jgi:hypothetical protein
MCRIPKVAVSKLEALQIWEVVDTVTAGETFENIRESSLIAQVVAVIVMMIV